MNEKKQIAFLEDQRMGTIRTKPAPLCPGCGDEMILRMPKDDQDWDPFWGCSNYPACDGIVQIGEDGNPIEDYEEW